MVAIFRKKVSSFEVQSFAQFRTFAQFRIIQIEEYLILLNDSAGEFKLLSEKVHSLTDISILNLLYCVWLIESKSSIRITGVK